MPGPIYDIESNTVGPQSMLGGIGSTIQSFLNPVGGLADLATKIYTMFKRTPEGWAKIDATMSQQDMEAWLTDIEKQVNAGTMSPGTAMSAVKMILASANAGTMSGAGGSAADVAGKRNVSAKAAQILANLQSKYNYALNEPLENQTDRIGGSGAPEGEAFQQAKLRTALRNALAGTSQGEGLRNVGSPLYKLIQGSGMSTPEEMGTKFSDTKNMLMSEFPSKEMNYGGVDETIKRIRQRFSKDEEA